MKNIFFIRHGESRANVDISFKGENALTDTGMTQARVVAERFKHVKIDVINETSKARSKQTAKEIYGLHQDVQVYESDLFRERRGDFELLYEFKDLPPEDIAAAMRKKLGMPGWEHGEQESFVHLKERARKALDYLESLPHDHIAVVAHGVFFRFLIAYMLLRDTLSEEQAAFMMNGMTMQNTGITVCSFDPGKKAWKLIAWNDQSHVWDNWPF